MSPKMGGSKTIHPFYHQQSPRSQGAVPGRDSATARNPSVRWLNRASPQRGVTGRVGAGKAGRERRHHRQVGRGNGRSGSTDLADESERRGVDGSWRHARWAQGVHVDRDRPHGVESAGSDGNWMGSGSRRKTVWAGNDESGKWSLELESGGAEQSFWVFHVPLEPADLWDLG